MLCHPDGERMPGGRCRVHVGGRVINDDEPFADPFGWVTVVVPRGTDLVFVEWAPSHTPLEAPFPYQKWHYAKPLVEDEKEAARRRLHNLGFSSQPTLRENIQDFQFVYGHAALSGELEHIEPELQEFHERGNVEIVSDENLSVSLFSPSSPTDRDLPRAPDAPPPGSPAGKGHRKADNLLGQTTSKTPGTGIVTENINDVIGQNRHDFAWIRIRTAFTNAIGSYVGHFWVFEDALKESSSRLRLPCRAAEAQKACDQLMVSPAELPDFGDTDVTAKVPSLIPTSSLYDHRYRLATIKVDPCPQKITDRITRTSKLMNDCIDKQVASHPHQRFSNFVADPGKVWVLTTGISLSRAANYGFHVALGSVKRGTCPDLKDPAKKRACFMSNRPVIEVAPATTNRPLDLNKQFVINGVLKGHSPYHIDYSQILVLVAGWCEIFGPKDRLPTVMRTRDVYRDTTLCRLVNHDGVPVPTQQPFKEADLKAARRAFFKKEREAWKRENARK